MRILFCAIVLLLPISHSSADLLTGNEFHKDCKNGKSFVPAYVAGVTDNSAIHQAFARDIPAADLERSKPTKDLVSVIRPYCIPGNVTLDQVTDVVCKYLNDKPAVRHMGGAGIVQNALREALPCR